MKENKGFNWLIGLKSSVAFSKEEERLSRKKKELNG